MNIWLDDMRPAPKGWVWEKDPYIVIAHLSLQEEEGEIEEISLDHDLGISRYGVERRGLQVLQWVEMELHLHGLRRLVHLPRFSIHSDNPVGRKNMQAAIDSIERWRLKHVSDAA